MRGVALVTWVATVLTLASLAGGAGATPARFSLTFTGSHVADSTAEGGLRHEGRFTASAPFCPAGSARDVTQVAESGVLSVTRAHTCDDGSGSITVSLPVTRLEHGKSGFWKITEGTGKYATLRGSGTYLGEVLSGDPEDFGSIKYKTVWTGQVDFDVAAPVVAVTARAAKVKASRPTYSLRVTLVIRNEEAGARVAYSLTATSGRVFLASREGGTTTGRATLTLRIRPPRSARAVKLVVNAFDPVANESTTTRSIKLPSS